MTLPYRGVSITLHVVIKEKIRKEIILELNIAQYICSLLLIKLFIVYSDCPFNLLSAF